MSLRLIFSVIEIITVPFWITVAAKPPTPTTPKEKRLRNDFSVISTILIGLFLTMMWTLALAEALALTQQSNPDVARFFAKIHQPRRAIEHLSISSLLDAVHVPARVSPLRAAAGITAIAGGILRWLCYKELGAQFTYHITLLNQHKLITSGPYAYVRHPSYTGALMLHVGWVLWHFLPGSWVRESGVMASVVFWALISPSLVFVVTNVNMIAGRVEAEDLILRKEFGKEWEAWARNVPFRLVPGLY